MVRVDHQIKQATEQAAMDDHRSVASLVQKLISSYLIASGYLGQNNGINPNNSRNEFDTTSTSFGRRKHPTQTLTAQERGESSSVAAVDADNEVSNQMRTNAKTSEDDSPPEIETIDVDKLAHFIRRIIKEELS